MSAQSYGKYKSLTAATEATHSQAVDAITSVRVHMLSGTSPVFFDMKRGSAPTAATSNGDNLHVVHDGLRVIEIPFVVTGATVYFSLISAAAATVYIELVR